MYPLATKNRYSNVIINPQCLIGLRGNEAERNYSTNYRVDAVDTHFITGMHNNDCNLGI